MGEFFVGYAPAPPKLARFSILVGVAAIALGLGLGALAAAFQRSPGRGFEPTDWNASLTGTLVAEPYPHLLVQSDDGTDAVLLVRGGKNGTPEVSEDRDGQLYSARGALFTRNGHSLLELYGLEAMDKAGSLSAEPPRRGVEVTLSGEIVDAKCYFGRMKPGSGQTHRACAQYCVWSGIPPVLVTSKADGSLEHHVLTLPDGGPANDVVFDYLAEAVTVTGTLYETQLGLELRISPGSIIRR